MDAPSNLIAVVDDEPSVRRALERLFRSVGMSVQTYSSGTEFLASATAAPPHCVILDLHMPPPGGLDVLARMAAAGLLMPVIILTGQESQESRAQAAAAGVAAFLRKPADATTLLSTVAAALSPES